MGKIKKGLKGFLKARTRSIKIRPERWVEGVDTRGLRQAAKQYDRERAEALRNKPRHILNARGLGFFKR